MYDIMKKLSLVLLMLVCGFALQAQETLRIWQNGESEKVSLSAAQTMTYGNNGTTLTVAGVAYPVSAIDSITVVHQVKVVYNGQTATVSIPAALKADITAVIDGAHVTLTNTNVSNEVEFLLSGTSPNGSFTYEGAYKTTIRLNDVSLTSGRGAALDIHCGKRIDVVLENGTTNTLIDYEGGIQKACFYCSGHVEIGGGGTLNVTGKLTHAIKTKEYMELKKSVGVINIVGAASDAMHIGQYYRHRGGTVNITSATQGDGIQVETLTLADNLTPNPEKEDNGKIFIEGGILNIEMAHEDREAIKCNDSIIISGGMFDLTALGNGSRGIQTDGSMLIDATKGATDITIAAKGGLCTAEVDADDPHRCMGIKVDGDLTVNGGTVKVTNTGVKSRGIRVGGKYTKNGGTVTANVSLKN